MLSPNTEARNAFRIDTGINGSTHAKKAVSKVLFVRKQNMEAPQRKFTHVPSVKNKVKHPLNLWQNSVPSPMRNVIIGKDRRKPPVGPKRVCHPPVKLEKTGSPIIPIEI